MQFVVSEKISSIFYTICCYQLLNLLLHLIIYTAYVEGL